MTSSYRRITLLDSLSKTLESVIKQRLTLYVIDKQLLPDHQFGFCSGHSSTLSNYYLIEEHLCRNRYVALNSRDAEKAINKVWHSGLLFKLTHFFQFLDALLSLYFSYLIGLTTNIKKALSQPIRILSRVPQGEVLSPLLYILFTSDIPKRPQIFHTSQHMLNTNQMSSPYNLDDVLCKIKHEIDIINSYEMQLKLQSNPTKGGVVLMHPYKMKLKNTKLYHHSTFNKTELLFLNSIKILGFPFQSKLSLIKYHNGTLNSAKAAFSKMSKF